MFHVLLFIFQIEESSPWYYITKHNSGYLKLVDTQSRATYYKQIDMNYIGLYYEIVEGLYPHMLQRCGVHSLILPRQ